MFLGLLRNIPILNSFLGKSAASQESSETEAAAKANEKAIAQEGLKPLFIVALPEGNFSELKAKLKEKFSGRDLHFEIDPELKKPKLYIIKPNALAKRNSETALDKAFIKGNYRSIELSGDANKLGESLVRAMSSELISLKEAEKANSRQSLESLSKVKAELASPAERLKAVGVNSCANGTCGHDHGDVGGGNSLDRNNKDQLVRSFISVSSINNNETVTEEVTSKAQLVNNKDTVRRTTPQASTQEQGNQGSQANTQNRKTNKPSSNPFSPQTIINNIASAAESIINTGQTIINTGQTIIIDTVQKTWSQLFSKPKHTEHKKPENIQKSPRSHNSAQLQIAQQRREDLKAFLTKGQK